MLKYSLLLLAALAACTPSGSEQRQDKNDSESPDTATPTALTTPDVPVVSVTPSAYTDTTAHDTDDPAIWVNPEDPARSLIIGTDKEAGGGLYVFDLDGKIVPGRSVLGLERPNNVDVEYGLMLNGQPTDIAVTTERYTHKLRIYSLPDMQPVDGGGLPVFEGETGAEYRDLMGIGLYKRPSDGTIFAIVGRKTGPTDGTYLWQYRLEDNGSGQVSATLVRKFGNFSGRHEIEAIAVDDELGYVYYSDETVGVRKYYADPEQGNEELAMFATEGFAEDHEGISLYTMPDGTGYILVSDQQANRFHIFTREGYKGNPHDHRLVKIIETETLESDGSETVSVNLGPAYPHGLFVAMSEGKTFQLYPWEVIAGDELKVRSQD
ncbi:phytase [Roseivirga sp. BDSF3-8]|uniref:phytase n=1 Tax=Roseivirga sp. BDSF3-8 TaxID=3241598 RepID=UPI003531A4E3